MATSVDATNYDYASGNGDGIYLSHASEPWSLNGITPTVTAATTASGYATIAAKDASGVGSVNTIWGFDSSAHATAFINAVGTMQAALIAKGIIS